MSNTIRPKVSEALKQIASSDRSGNSKAKVDTKNEFKALQDYLSGNYEELNTTEKNTIQRLLDNAKECLKNAIGNEEQSNKITDKKTNNDDDSITSKYDDNNVDQTVENTGDIVPNGDDDSVTSKYDDNNVDQTAENTGDIVPNGDDDSVTSKYDDYNVDQTIENTGDIVPNGDDDSITSKYDDNNVDQTVENTGDIVPNGDDDSVSKDDFFNNAYDKLEKETQENTTGIENTYNNQNKMPGKKVMHDGKMCIEMPNGHLYDMQGRRIK